MVTNKKLPKLFMERSLNFELHNCYWMIINDTNDPFMVEIQEMLFETGRDWRHPINGIPQNLFLGADFYAIGKQESYDEDVSFGFFYDSIQLNQWKDLYVSDDFTYKEFKASDIIRRYGNK